jgi:GNAT superfamily N-acetyltransferase
MAAFRTRAEAAVIVGFSNSISRFADYYRRHGLVATIRRARLAGRRALFRNRMMVFYCDLDVPRPRSASIPEPLVVEQVNAPAELSAEHLEEMTRFWNSKLANRNIRGRFDKGASLWLVRSENQLVGYGWALQGRTIESYYFPLTPVDVHLFDFHVFPRYRGRGVNPYLIGCILDGFTTNCGGRAFIDAAEWNDAQLASLRKTAFRCLGSVRSFTILGHTFVSWSEYVAAAQEYREQSRRIRI